MRETSIGTIRSAKAANQPLDRLRPTHPGALIFGKRGYCNADKSSGTALVRRAFYPVFRWAIRMARAQPLRRWAGFGKFAPQRLDPVGSPPKRKRSHKAKDSFEEIAYSNNLLLRALIGVLSDKGFVSTGEVERRTREIATEAHSLRGIGQGPPPLVSFGDLISANMVALELLLSILCDKGLFSREEIAALSQKLSEDIRKRALKIQ